jgi:hypothetical protein
MDPTSAILAAVILVSMSLYARAQHRNALSGKRLKWLQDLGFTVENKGRYWGYRGIYKGFFTRIYVEPSSRFPKRLGPDLCIMVYFQPMRRADGKRDIALLRRIENEILNEPSWILTELLSCHAIHMRQFTRFTLFTGRSRIEKRLNRVHGAVIKHGLKPWPEHEVEEWVRAAPELHGPDTSLFQENLREALRKGQV